VRRAILQVSSLAETGAGFVYRAAMSERSR